MSASCITKAGFQLLLPTEVSIEFDLEKIRESQTEVTQQCDKQTVSFQRTQTVIIELKSDRSPFILPDAGKLKAENMSTGSEANELDREVDASMRMFEKAQVGPAASLTPIKPSRILVVLDGSSQDDNTLASATFLREKFNTETLVLDARDGKTEQDEDLAVTRATEVSGARPIQRQDGDSYDAILAALKELSVDLLILPSPFGRSFENIGIDSAGTVMDVMLSRCPTPMIVMRRDDQELRDCVQHIEMVVGSECEVEERAAAWSFGLAAESANVTLNLVLEKEQFENIRSIIEVIQPEAQIDAEKIQRRINQNPSFPPWCNGKDSHDTWHELRIASNRGRGRATKLSGRNQKAANGVTVGSRRSIRAGFCSGSHPQKSPPRSDRLGTCPQNQLNKSPPRTTARSQSPEFPDDLLRIRTDLRITAANDGSCGGYRWSDSCRYPSNREPDPTTVADLASPAGSFHPTSCRLSASTLPHGQPVNGSCLGHRYRYFSKHDTA